MQLVLLALAAVLVAHGLFGPQLAPANLSTVLTWVHYRGLLIVVLLAAGNLFCTGCPFILVRDAARRLHAPTARWPRWLRRKWPALALFVAVLFVYELFDLWALPRATAWLVLGYFGAALAIDVAFTGRQLLQVRLPDRAVQLHRLHAVAARGAGPPARDVPGVPDGGLHQGAPRSRRRRCA